jgi:hypothetical protein
VNCSAIPEAPFEAELFGYRKGAFTGAVSDKLGLFEAAHCSTLRARETRSLSKGLYSLGSGGAKGKRRSGDRLQDCSPLRDLSLPIYKQLLTVANASRWHSRQRDMQHVSRQRQFVDWNAGPSCNCGWLKGLTRTISKVSASKVSGTALAGVRDRAARSRERCAPGRFACG